MRRRDYLKFFVVLTAGVFAIPIIINEAYKYGKGYVTMWNAADMLSFYGAMLSFIGTVILGLIATNQSRKANELSHKMLELEESRDLPIIDITEIMDDDEQISAEKFNNSLQICLNDNFFHVNDDKTLVEGSCSIAVFKLVNICSNHIISLLVHDVAQATIFSNGKTVVTEVNRLEYNGGIRVLGRNESQYLLIGGVRYDYPPSLSKQEAFEQNYINPIIELKITFLLGNIKGKKYLETIEIFYMYIPSPDGINYPCILKKEILGIKEDVNHKNSEV